jgi:hypothetical protein
MNSDEQDVIRENYEKFKSIVLEHGDTLLMDACRGPTPPPQLSETRDEFIKRVACFIMNVDEDSSGFLKIKQSKSRDQHSGPGGSFSMPFDKLRPRGPSVPLCYADEFRWPGDNAEALVSSLESTGENGKAIEAFFKENTQSQKEE